MTTAPTLNEPILPNLQRYFSHESIAKEPWDDESVLYVPKDRLIFIDCSGAESIAALIYLNTLNLKFSINRVKNANDMSPSGVGPLLKCGRYSIGEYEPIVTFCNLKGFRLLYDFLNQSNKSLIKSYILLIQTCFSNAIDYFLWKEPVGWKMIKQVFRENYAWPLSDILYYSEYKHAKNRLTYTEKIWNLNSKEVLDRFTEVIEAINRKLNGNLFLIENSMTEADIVLYSFMKFVKANPTLDIIGHCLYNHSNLTDFYLNLDEKYSELVKTELNM